MLKIKCRSCNYANVYENERHAWMDGWNWVGHNEGPDGYNGSRRVRNIPICEKCNNNSSKEVTDSQTVVVVL